MLPRCWTPGPATDIVLATWPVLVARNGCSNAEGDQQLWAKHPVWRHLCQSPSVTHHCYCTIRVATHWLYQYWDDDGVGSTPKHGEHFCLCDHFMIHVMVYVTLDQTVKTVAKFLWQDYISIFRAPANLLSDWGANFESNIIIELCELMGIWKARTLPYHAQTNGQMEWAPQMLMSMIGKLGRNWKVELLKHLPKLVYACNSTGLAVTRYSLHYLMFRGQPTYPLASVSPW